MEAIKHRAVSLVHLLVSKGFHWSKSRSDISVHQLSTYILGSALFQNLRRLKLKHAINLLRVCQKAKCDKVHVIKEKQQSDNSGLSGQSCLNIEWKFFKWNKYVQFLKSSKLKIKNRILYVNVIFLSYHWYIYFILLLLLFLF